jgi:DNA-binding CsgD family transcriptional regulator
MGRKCTVCSHVDREKLDAAIVEGAGSAGAIARQFGVSKNSILNHRKHIDGEMKSAHADYAVELKAILQRADGVIAQLKIHLKKKPRAALSLDWIRESRDLRGWLTFRAKALGKIAPVGDSQKRSGDSYNVLFVLPDGTQAKIPLAIYGALPALKNGAETSESGHQMDTSAVSASVHAGLGEN